MAESVLPLPALYETQRAQALQRFIIIRLVLKEGISQAQVAYTHQIAPSTIHLWIKHSREKSLLGLANNIAHLEKEMSRKLPQTAAQLIEGRALPILPRSAASIHHQVTTIAKDQEWNLPSYHHVYTSPDSLEQLDLTSGMLPTTLFTRGVCPSVSGAL